MNDDFIYTNEERMWDEVVLLLMRGQFPAESAAAEAKIIIDSRREYFNKEAK